MQAVVCELVGSNKQFRMGLLGLNFNLGRRQGRRMPNANTPSISLQHRAVLIHLKDKQVSTDRITKLFS